MRTTCFIITVFFATSCGTNKQSERNTNSSELPSENIDVLTTLKMANEYYEKDIYEQAAERFELAIQLDSTIGEAYYKLGYSLSATKKSLLEEAQQKGEELTEDLLSQKDTSALKIISNFVKAAELNFRPADAFYNAGIYTSIFIFDDSTAIEFFRKSLELNPNQPEVIMMIEDAEQRLKIESTIQ